MIAVVVPCFNEAHRLKADQFKDFIEKNSNYHFYFVDDGSNDNTFELLTRSFSNVKRCSIFNVVENVGKGEAIRTAIKRIDINRYEYVSFIDADLEIPLNQLIKLSKKISTYPRSLIVISRRTNRNKEKRFFIRNLGSKMISLISQKLLRLNNPIVDTQCGCKMLRVEIVHIFEKPFISSWLFDLEILLRIRNYKKRSDQWIHEVSLHELNSVNAKRNYTFKSALHLTNQLYKINRAYN
ncbi:Glycosyl transferase family 2 [Nonlabens sp. Hel1_33_55]|uniref:glycosyltransferase family 2 protein n=1 Tax=Nonlabens sp. Hel1_33_55 TaxID=1336802 RepID=UPI000875BC64|nr:glycosyltransferase family 2 protein [Nonlabens sp. Hel1_33_55]SCX92005.1 Glycosyl transferase family 2 [Nonlabens sp. Hel1_33_55]